MIGRTTVLTLWALTALLAQPSHPLRLSMKRAVELATSPEGNANIQIADEAVRQAQSREKQARSALLPSLDAAVSEQSLTRNLAAMGIRFTSPLPGFAFPTFVGPFHVFDARVTGTQTIFDFSSIRRLQASRQNVKAARSNAGGVADQVAAQVARAYLAALRAQADLDAAQANVDLSIALLRLAEHQKAAGTGTGIEVTRAKVQASNEAQRLLLATDARRRSYLQLRRAIGIRLDAEIELTDRLAYIPVEVATIEQAESLALKSRADLASQQEREQNARLSSSATRLERLPSVSAFGDYGSIGTAIHNSLPTRTYGVSVRVPIFDGGRRDARREEANSMYRQERIRTGDLKEQIALEVRLALDSLRSAEQQVRVAEEGLGLSENELAQARRRYEAGVANGVEVTDAQTRLARARDNQVNALFHYNQARLDLGQATGTIRSMIP